MTICSLKMMVKSGLEKIIVGIDLNSSSIRKPLTRAPVRHRDINKVISKY